VTPPAMAEPASALFDRWAEVYDSSANPLLMLEEQLLPELLPAIPGLHVLDVGCGTGRWLSRLEALRPAALLGTDSSPAMLRYARARLDAATGLLLHDACTLPVPDASQDLILSSFVLSYLQHLPAFAAECARALKPGGILLLSDMHPQTAAERNWTRSFISAGETVHIPTSPQPLAHILQLFEHAGLEVLQLREPSFQPEQRELFIHAKYLKQFEELADVPAIYLLKLRKAAVPPHALRSPLRASVQLTNVRWSIGPSSWCDTPVSIERGVISKARTLSSSAWGAVDLPLDLSGYVLLPGLINAHDHLEFALFPRLGRPATDPPFKNAAEWAHEIHHRHAASIADHSQVPLETRVWWGAIRNLLCGVTTVCHHNRMHPELLDPQFPVRVVTGMGWGHSLAFEPDLARQFREAAADRPFILHAAEGTDASSRSELAQLDRMGLLDRRTILVHGLALVAEDVALLNRRGAALVLCPTSNQYLFHRTHTSSFIDSVDRIALGSDSPITAEGDLLDEVHHLRVEQDLDPYILFRLATAAPASMLQLRRGEGHLLPGGRADLIAVKDAGVTPAETLAHLTFADVELVLISGQVQLASPEIYGRLAQSQQSGLHRLRVDSIERWIRAPLPSLFHSAEQVLGRDNLCLGGRKLSYGRPD
jgi:cytosine/adenosine deaminase-related metal-dependent hydrolase/ubiquinone/menaquinone biosynthesis C-methylase UbiE